MHSIGAILLALTLPVMVMSLNVTEKPYDPIIEVINANSNDLNCELDWHLFGDKCFKYHNDLLGANFHDAITICEKTYGAQLATIHSEKEGQFLNSMLFNVHQSKFSAWIGLVRISNSTFIWLDRSPLNYTNWAPREPNNWNSKNFCVVLSSQSTFQGMWYDVGCTSTYVVICEKPNKSSQLQNNERQLENNIGQLKDNLTQLQKDFLKLKSNLINLENRFNSNQTKLMYNFLKFQTRFSNISTNETLLQLNLSDFDENLSTLDTNMQTMWSRVQINFVLTIFIVMFLVSVLLCSKLFRFCENNSESHSPISRHKIWFTRTDKTVDSMYVPSRINRFYHSTLGKLKSVKSFPSRLSATYTAQTGADTDFILTSENVATSI